MDDRTSFANELVSLKNDIADDVGGILKVVQERKAPKLTKGDSSADERATTKPAGEEATPPRPRRPQPKQTPDEPMIMDNVTTRLSRETNERLTEAALHQKLKKIQPDTRQGIIEVAVREWLKRERYCSSKQE
jgi:hypothetical protein